MALNYKKSGDQALVVLAPGQTVEAGDFHIIGKQLGVALSSGVEGDEIAVSLAGVWDLPCGGDAFEPGTPLHFSIPDLELYAGVPEVSDFENVAISWSEGGGAIENCLAKINTHIAESVA